MQRSKNEIFSTGCSDCSVVFHPGHGMDVFPGAAFNAMGHSGTDVICRRAAAFFAGISVMCFLARNAGPSPTRYALAAGISTIAIISAVLGIAEWREVHVSGQILFAVLIELLLGAAFLLSNRAPAKNVTGKYQRIKNK